MSFSMVIDPKKQNLSFEKDEQFAKLYKLLNDIRFGQITISIQNGKIVQVEVSEKYRLNEL
jgi:hypothetical protein